jgi:hypothetical protein
LVLFQVYHNFALPHASLRRALAEPIPTNGNWFSQGMAATDTRNGGRTH